MLDTVNTGVIDTIKTNITSNNGSNKFYELMVSGSASSRSAAIGVMMNATYAVSMLLVLIISFTRYFAELEKGADPKESLYKTLMQVFLIGIFVINIDAFLGYVIDVGEWFIDQMTGLADSQPAITAVTLEQLTGQATGGALWWIMSVALLIIPWILSLILQIGAQIISFSILIELGIRKAFAPFAIVDIYSEGMRSPGMRYLKKYLATFLKIAIALMVCYFGVEMMELCIEVFDDAGGLSGAMKYIFQVITINFTIIGVIIKAGGYANDIVGV
jgi:hypothetical protein